MCSDARGLGDHHYDRVFELFDREGNPNGFIDLGDVARKANIPHHGLRGLAAYLLKIRISKNSIIQLKPHAGDTWGSFGNINKLKKYKWKPKFSLVKGLKKTILDLKTSKI